MNIKTKLQNIFLEAKESFSLSLPLIASNLLKASSGFVGTLMVAHLGKLTLGALALGASVFFTLVVFFIGMLNSVSVLVSQNYGAKNKEGIRIAVSQGFVMAIAVSIPMYFITWLSPLVFHLTHENAEITRLATIYLRAISLAILPFCFLVIMNQFLVGMSKTRLVLCISLLQVPFEILFTYLFVYGGLGIPRCGIAGVGYAFALVFSAAAICVGLFIYKSKRYSHFKVFSRFGRIQYDYLIELIRIGWPMGCMSVIEVALFAIIAFFMGSVGGDQLAAYQIYTQYMGISIVIIMAFSQVATIRVGQAVGRQDSQAISRAIYVIMLLGTVFMLILWGGIIGFSKEVIGIDINMSNPKNLQIIHYAIIFLIFGGAIDLLDNFRLIAVGSLRGLKDTKEPMKISLASFWLVALPCAYCLTFIFDFGAPGLMMGILAGVVTGLTLQLIRLRKRIRTIDLKKCYMINKSN